MLSTVNKVLAMAVAVLLFLSVSLGVLWHIRGNTIAGQKEEIAKQEKVISQYASSQAAQAKADKQLKAENKAITDGKDKQIKELTDALKDNVCANTELPDDAKRVLKELYGS